MSNFAQVFCEFYARAAIVAVGISIPVLIGVIVYSCIAGKSTKPTASKVKHR